jgi:resuscitation-promoting factor RpfA
MVHESNARPLSGDLAGLVGRTAIGVVAVGALLLGLALLSELLRRRHRARPLLALLDASLPGGARTAAVSLLAVAATFLGARPAGAEDSVRGWLGRPTTSTSVPARIATPETVDELVEPAPPSTISGPVVLIPPTVEVPPEPRSTAPAPAPAPAPAVVPPPVASAPASPIAAAPMPTYVVQPGDCLWAIAARVLGPGADGRAIDAGWRRIYDTNRAAVGENPSLIHIGLVLQLPPLSAQP